MNHIATQPLRNAAAGDDAGGTDRWRVLALLALAVLLAMSLWFTASASADHFARRWQLDDGQVAALTTLVQLGFVAGTALVAVLNLADLLPSRLLFAGCALAAAAANALLLAAPGYRGALALRFLTGLLLAGVYPPAMKMAATWFRAARGLAIGVVVGALTVGKAAPYLVHALAGAVHPAFVIGSTSIGAVIAALAVGATYRDGPFAFPRRQFSWSLVGVVWQHRPTRLAIGSYLGHMWELYACWALIAVFLSDFFLHRGAAPVQASAYAGIGAFAVIAAGGLGSAVAGWWADRLGRERIAIWSMAVSGSCSLVAGHLVGAPLPLVLFVTLLWGFTVVADSAQFSALVADVAPPHAVGTALTLQTSIGFLLTALSIWIGVAVRAACGWPWAFSLLAAGPLVGIITMVRLKRLRAADA